MNISYIKRIKEAHKKLVFHDFCKQKNCRKKIFVKGKDCYIYDENKKRYLDFASNIFNVSLGYNNSYIINSIQKQLKILPVTQAGNIPQSELSIKLQKIFSSFFGRVFYSTSGSQAVETAIKIARQVTGKQKIASFINSYHGSTYEAANCGGINMMINSFGPPLPNHIKLLPAYCYRCPFEEEDTNCNFTCINYVENIIQNEDADTIAGLIFEPINWYFGITPPENYWKEIKKICKKNSILFIADEVVTGFGRTGKMSALEHWKILPDIFIGSKGLTSGYLPLAITIVNKSIAHFYKDVFFPHGFTYQGHPLCCAAALATLQEIEKRHILKNVQKNGEYLHKRLNELKENHFIIGDVRGRGLLAIIELIKDKKKTPINETTSKILLEKIYNYGLLIENSAPHIFIIAPPLIVKKEQIDKSIEIIDNVFKYIEKKRL
jgi:taurine--2-oxoglutarate transaminase